MMHQEQIESYQGQLKEKDQKIKTLEVELQRKQSQIDSEIRMAMENYRELDNRLNQQMMQISGINIKGGKQIDQVEVDSRVKRYEAQIEEFRQEQLKNIGQFIEDDINQNMVQLMENYKRQIQEQFNQPIQ